MKRTFTKWIALFASLCLLTGVMPVSATSIRSLPADMLEAMTLEEKIGQMLMPAFQTWNGQNVTSINSSIRAAIEKYQFGGVILFASNTAGTKQTTELVYDLQAASKIPMLISLDQEGGYVYRLGTGTETPGNMALGATGDPACAKEAGSIIGSELAAEGFNVDFAPVMDVNNNPNNPVIGIRSFSDDPALTAKMGAAFLEGLHNEHVAAALKHFPGHGDTQTDSHSGLPCINKSLSQLRNFELIPFAAGIEAGADIIMTAHIQYPQIEAETYVSKSTGQKITLPATLSHTILTELLRGQMGYQGVICTDAMSMDAIAVHFDRMDAARLAINAGVDILLMPVTMGNAAGVDDCGSYIQGIARMVREGKIKQSTIDNAVMRILTMKIDRGLLDQPLDKAAQVQKALATVGSRENHEWEWAIMEKAVTVVKNEDNTLPIQVKSGGKVVLFCSYDNEIPAITFALDRLKTEGRIPKDADYRIYCYQGHNLSEYDSVLRSADSVIASVESYRTANVAGGWQAQFLDALISRVHVLGKRITVLSIQLPYDLARYQKADALLAAYCSNGMTSIPTYQGETPAYGVNLPVAIYGIFGGCSLSGTLPVNIPKLDSAYAYTSTVLYPRGYGLTVNSSAFVDVPKDSYFYDAVNWAVEKDITTGTTPTTFRPDSPCTRAQVVTFLWRAAGCPEPEEDDCFEDVPADSYFYDAVRWAVERGITTGATETAFRPNNPCTRAQFVTFLWRAAGCPEPEEDNGFEDVPADSYFYDAVNWAVELGITTGATKTAFRPNNTCTRAQTVTFLWRARS